MPAIAAGQEADVLAGEWVGAWGRDADTLAVTMRFDQPEGVWTGSFDSERLRVDGIPFTSVTFDPPQVGVLLVGDATTMEFAGRVQGDSLTGTLREGEANPGWFALSRRRVAPPALREEEVRFSNGGVELAGTLLLPAGAGPHPAVVFVHGSGGEGRWASRYLARRLAREGFAALIWDKRGVGESTGWWPEASFEDLAGDAAAAVAYLRTRAEIDPARVGIHGHSQGGTIAPLVAVRSEADFVIASAASGVSMVDAEIYSIGNAIGISSLPPEEAAIARAYVEAIVDAAYRGGTREALEAAADRARGHPWFFEPPAPDAPYWGFSKLIADFDPLAWWQRVEAPVLLVYGSADERVPVEASRAAIVRALEDAGAAEIEVQVFEGADHTFRIRREGDAWPRTVPGYPDAILEWLRNTLTSKSPL
jgi:dienelactone hydrolase